MSRQFWKTSCCGNLCSWWRLPLSVQELHHKNTAKSTNTFFWGHLVHFLLVLQSSCRKTTCLSSRQSPLLAAWFRFCNGWKCLLTLWQHRSQLAGLISIVKLIIFCTRLLLWSKIAYNFLCIFARRSDSRKRGLWIHPSNAVTIDRRNKVHSIAKIDKVPWSSRNYCLRNNSRNHLQRALVYILLLLYLSPDSVAAQTSISTSNLNSIVKLFIFVHDCFDEVQLPATFLRKYVHI